MSTWNKRAKSTRKKLRSRFASVPFTPREGSFWSVHRLDACVTKWFTESRNWFWIVFRYILYPYPASLHQSFLQDLLRPTSNYNSFRILSQHHWPACSPKRDSLSTDLPGPPPHCPGKEVQIPPLSYIPIAIYFSSSPPSRRDQKEKSPIPNGIEDFLVSRTDLDIGCFFSFLNIAFVHKKSQNYSTNPGSDFTYNHR